MSLRLRDGSVTEDPRLDAILFHDPRSRRFAAVEHPAVAAGVPKSMTWNIPDGALPEDPLGWLPQGGEGACTGFAVAHEAAMRPVPIPGLTRAVARALYVRARQLDHIPDEEGEGSTVLAAVQAGQEAGYYGEYRWAFGEEDLWVSVPNLGPAILGIPWFSGMYKPNAHGYLVPSGDHVGYHAIACHSTNLPNDDYGVLNSWDTFGPVRISREHMKYLLDSRWQSVACIPVVRGVGI